MAINITDFDKIWASTSPLTPYAFSDANYQQGWNFVGATPPARQMWDFLQKRNDEKTQWLYNNKLSLSGGTMTGTIVADDTNIIKNANDTTFIKIAGGTRFEDSYIGIWGKNNSVSPGAILLRAYDGTNAQSLFIGATALPTFAGQTIDTIAAENATASGYIRYKTGLKMCWTTITLTASNYSTGVKWTFPDSGFSSAPVVLISANGPTPTYYNSDSTTSVTIKSNQTSSNLSCSVFAIGVKI